MTTEFDADAIRQHGWRQGAVLGSAVAIDARQSAPPVVTVGDDDWLILVSHDCDVHNPSLAKEPTVEVLRAGAVTCKRLDKQRVGGRNPREVLLETVDDAGSSVVLNANAHGRWWVSRELLETGKPRCFLDERNRRLLAEWLAKRYIRSAFPSAFDARWHPKMREWLSLLQRHSRWIQGVYLKLDTLSELTPDSSYRANIVLVAPTAFAGDAGWQDKSEEIERDVFAFWGQFAPAIRCDDVRVAATCDVTLADIESYQRFDADWVSFGDDSSSMPVTADMVG